MLDCRTIRPEDDAALAKIIRANLERCHLDRPGTVYFDPELDHLSAFYRRDPARRVYFVALDEAGQPIGGIGAAEFEGIEDCAEMQKLYLDDRAKGKGYGRALIALVEDWARQAGYRTLYLETHTNFATAVKLYEKMGFHRIDRPAAVVHGTMDQFFLRSL